MAYCRLRGEPLVRRGIMTLVGSLSPHLRSGERDELTLTTNGSQSKNIRAISLRRHSPHEGNDLLHGAIDEAIGRKPKRHAFIIDRRHRRPAIAGHMSVTGG